MSGRRNLAGSLGTANLLSRQLGNQDRGNRASKPTDRIRQNRGESRTASDGGSHAERITADTVYLVKEFDLKQNTCKDSICSIPVSYIGMNREQFLKEMNSFMASPPFAELEKGFASLEVSEFSTARVTVTKYYREHEEDCFWLQVENNFVVVFLEDRKTRYEITDIYLPYLPEDLQQEIIQGKKMEGKEVLYNFLESYSS